MEEKDLEKVVLLGLEYESVEKEKAAERKALTRKNGLKEEDAQYNDGTKGQTRDIVAKKLGVSGKHWEHMKYVYQHKDSLSNTEYQAWRYGKVSTTKMYNHLCEVFEYKNILESIIASMVELEEEIIQYNNSYIDVDFKHTLMDVLWSCREADKKIINEKYEKFVEEKHNFVKEQWSRMTSLRMRLELLKNDIQ